MNEETRRLILRLPRLEDVPSLFEFMGDPNAMRHTHADASMQACRRRVAVHEWRRRRDGCAPWTIVSKHNQEIIGWGGLYDDPFDPGWGVEVAYLFRPSAWGNGFATELVMHCLGVAASVLKLPEVKAFTHPENVGSRHVLEKAGFEVVHFLPDMNRHLFRRALHGAEHTDGPSNQHLV